MSVITLDHLRKVRGMNFEDVLENIVGRSLQYYVHQTPQVTDKRYNTIVYFRESEIKIKQEDVANLFASLEGDKNIRNNGFWIRAYYEILPAFDRSQLDGPIVMSKGLLVERVRISGVKNFNLSQLKYT